MLSRPSTIDFTEFNESGERPIFRVVVINHSSLQGKGNKAFHGSDSLPLRTFAFARYNFGIQSSMLFLGDFFLADFLLFADFALAFFASLACDSIFFSSSSECSKCPSTC